MRIVMGDAKLFKNYLNVLNVIADEVPFKVTANGLSVKVMDPTHVSMINFSIPREAMDEFDYDGGDEGMKFTIGLEELIKKHLKDLRKDTRIEIKRARPAILEDLPTLPELEGEPLPSIRKELTADALNGNHAPFPDLANDIDPTKVRSSKGNSPLPFLEKSDIEREAEEAAKTMMITLSDTMKRQYQIPILESYSDDYPIPTIATDVQFRIMADEFNRAINNLADVGDNMSITVTKDKVELHTEGEEDKNVTIPFAKGDECMLSIEARNDAKTDYSISYMQKIMKAIKAVSDIIAIEFKTGMPLIMTAEMAHQGTMKYYLAPRIGKE